MSITLPGHAAPRVGFEVPLEMLAACHLRVQDQCATLLRLAPHVAAQGADRPAREAAMAVMHYFDTSARHHHDDEEHDLFPALIESMAGSDAVCLRELTAALTAEHRELEARWRALRAVLEQVAAGQTVPFAPDAVGGFARQYAQHIAREESELLPMARRLLSDAELDRIGLAMRARRAVPGAIDDARVGTHAGAHVDAHADAHADLTRDAHAPGGAASPSKPRGPQMHRSMRPGAERGTW